MHLTSGQPSPIFILGLLPRSGTNHLWDLLGLHPGTELMHPVYEDHLVRWSPHLVHYAEDVSQRWSPEWEVPSEEAAELLRSLGDGVAAWITGQSQRHVVTKMPSMEHADRFFDIFRSGPLLVVVRDGRSLAESGVRTFGWTYERAFRAYAASAQTLLDLQATAQSDRLHTVRFEDLVEHPDSTVRRLCEHCELDPDDFPYDRIADLPVRGSSALAGDGGNVHWAPTDKPEGFAPVERWHDWSPHLHRRFAELAGEQQRALGYELLDPPGSDTVGQRVGDFRDVVLDSMWRDARQRLGRVRRAVPRALKGE